MFLKKNVDNSAILFYNIKSFLHYNRLNKGVHQMMLKRDFPSASSDEHLFLFRRSIYEARGSSENSVRLRYFRNY